jgi:hypothetical protein
MFLCLFAVPVSSAGVESSDSYVADTEYHDDEDYKDEDDESESVSGLHPVITSEPLFLEVDEGDRVELPCRGDHLRKWRKR